MNFQEVLEVSWFPFLQKLLSGKGDVNQTILACRIILQIQYFVLLSVTVSQSMWMYPVQRQGNNILHYPCCCSWWVNLRSAGAKLDGLKQEPIISY